MMLTVVMTISSTNLTGLHGAPTMGGVQGTKQTPLPAFRESILVGKTDKQKNAEYAGKSCHNHYYCKNNDSGSVHYCSVGATVCPALC